MVGGHFVGDQTDDTMDDWISGCVAGVGLAAATDVLADPGPGGAPGCLSRGLGRGLLSGPYIDYISLP